MHQLQESVKCYPEGYRILILKLEIFEFLSQQNDEHVNPEPILELMI